VKKELAETLLAKIMDWSDEQKATERARLESLAAYKYDEYQQYAPGRRFVESLALWLRQFDKGAEREAAYDFVCNRLVFVSSSEMDHLVELAFPTMIRSALMEDAARDANIDPTRLKSVMASKAYRARLRRTLVLGLSDGARTDQFRRYNPLDVSHEQVFHAYDVSDAKADGLVGKLKKDLTTIHGAPPDEEETTFQYVVLLDDFTASGTSYIREEEDPDSGEISWAGKIPKIIDQLEAEDGLGGAIASSGVKVIVVIYVAAEQAIQYIEKRLPKLGFSKGEIELKIVHPLSSDTKLSPPRDQAIIDLIEKPEYFDASAHDEHSDVGKSSVKYGFAGCMLPVILDHNAPNNSIYLLWAEDIHSVRGLFPRVSRHRKFKST
jgi:hypothetical protein